ncbi:VIT domain-containing protein [Rhizohabitans arisaemae]|uniref:VIT domain-containing protein n=1 Tax=Rhizohabitans arisaemae TaxID=2720610 RepID=UPI0024B23513|nr:VIT domain-containing protein [Rhizohabitans arisaemae]
MIVTVLPAGECDTTPDAGLGALATDRGNLPLESLDVQARITGLVSGVEVTQMFRNPFDVPLEATYIFPLPPRAAVTALRMEADDRVVEGVLKERGEARQDYDQALAAGRRAAIAEEERPDVFTIRVGNILPGERVGIHLTLSQPLPYEDGAATFRFPLVVAPRYIPGVPLGDLPAGDGTVRDTDAVPDASRITPPTLLPGFPSPVRLSLTARLDPAGLTVRELRSSLHEVEVTGNTISLRPGERLDRDFILRLVLDEAEQSSLAVAPDEDGDEGTFTLTLVPPRQGATRRPRDVVLLLDRSGSMQGWKMIAARRAAARIVDTLSSEDRFGVLSFDHVVESPEDGLVAATDRHRFRAVEHLAKLDARGGTELLAALTLGVRLLDDPTRDRVLVLVTDGQVGNEDQILAGADLRGIRVHTVGIDRAVNAGFLGRLAAAGRGRCELVESEDRLDEAMDHIHRRIGAPLVTGLTVDAPGLIGETTTRMGDLFPGVPLVVSGRWRGAAPESARVRGTSSDGQAFERVVGAVRTADKAATVIWARAYLRDLEDRYAVAGDRSLEELITRTSLRFGVLCRFTALVAVDTRVAAEGGPRHRAIQPVELPSGWAPPAPMMFDSAMPPMAAPMAFTEAAPAAFSGIAPPGAAPAPPRAKHAAFPPPPPGGAGPIPAGAPLPLRQAAPAPAGPGTRKAVGLDPSVYAAIFQELTLLREVHPEDRRIHLADLGTRLQALLAGSGAAPELAALAEELLRCEDHTAVDQARLDELWQRTVDLLTSITTPPPQARPARRAFWKRGGA